MEYVTIDNFEKGTVFELLSRSFEPLMDAQLEEKLRRYDREVFENPDTIGASIFLTQHEEMMIGLVSWDPRQFPRAIVGYNSIVPEYQGKGYGQKQLLELLRRLKESRFNEVIATTGDHSFYMPSQKMYESCGFVELDRHKTSGDPRHGAIDYSIMI